MKIRHFYFHPGIIPLAFVFLIFMFGITTSLIHPAHALDYQPAQMNKSFSKISIPVGGTTRLTINIYNPNVFALTLATPAAWTDTLPVGISFATPPNLVTNCAGTVTMIGRDLTLVGGRVPAQANSTPGSCFVSVDVTSATSGNFVNTIDTGKLNATDEPTKTIPITNADPASATLEVDAVLPPTLSKTFAPNTIFAGATTVLSLSIRNTDPNYPLTQVSLTDSLPVNIVIGNPALPAGWNTNCGAATTVNGPGGQPLATNDIKLVLNNAAIPASGTCVIKINVTSSTPGIYTNIIPANTIQTLQGVTNAAAASAPLNIQEIGVTKTFSPGAFQVGGTSLLTITLKNPTNSNYTSVSLDDTLPVGLTLTIPAAATDCGGTLTATQGTRLISLKDGVIPPGTVTTPHQCTITATVTSAIAASYTNIIPVGGFTALDNALNVVTNIIPATANLTTYATGSGSSGSKNFSPSTIQVGGSSRLTINFVAPADIGLTNFTISDALPSGVVVAAVPNPGKSSCGASTFAPASGDTLLSFRGGTIAANTTCTLAVNVTSSQPGTYTNTISPANISNAENRNMAGNFSATLTVSGLSVSKVFDPISVNPDGVSTLTIKLTNTNYSQLDNVALTDNLPGSTNQGLVIGSPSNANTTCIGGNPVLTANPGTQAISLSGGTVPAQVGAIPGICTITLDVVGKGTSNTYTNIIGANNITGKIHGTSTVVSNMAPTSANLSITPISIDVVKGFNPITVFGGSSSTLTVQLSNPNSVPLTGITFTDSLPQDIARNGGMTIANPPHASVGTCDGTLTAIPGATALSFTGGSLGTGAAKSCLLTVDVTMNVDGNLTNTIPALAVTTINGATNGQKASATLTNTAGASVHKFFGPNRIMAGSGNSTSVTITIQNTGNVLLTDMGIIDTLPGNMTLAASPASIQCGGTVSGAGQLITLTGGQLAGSSSCNIVFSVTAPTAGTYQNCIQIGALTDTEKATNQELACDTLTVNNPPVISKNFLPSPTTVDGTTGLTFTILNPNMSSVLTGVAFTDNLPDGLTLASVPNASQCGGVISSTGQSISLTGGTLAANSSCTVTVSVTAAAGSSTLLNSLPASILQTSIGNNSAAISSTLTILPLIGTAPVLTQGFNPAVIQAGGTATLTLFLANSSTSEAALTASLSDPLPAGLVIAATPNTSNSCAGSALTANPGDTSLTMTGGAIPARTGSTAGSCLVSVDVTAAAAGSYSSTLAAGALNTSNGNTLAPTKATLTVLPMVVLLPPAVSSRFNPDTIQANGISTLSLTLSNPNLNAANLSTDLVNQLPPGLVIAASPNASTSCPGSILTAIATGANLTLSGGAIPAGSASSPGSCSINVDVTAATAGNYAAILSAGDLQTVNGNNNSPVTTTLSVVPISGKGPFLAESFNPNNLKPGATSTLTLTLTNPNNSLETLSGPLNDLLPAGLVIAAAPNSSNTCTGGNLTANAGESTFSLMTGAIPAQVADNTPGICSVKVDVTAGAAGSYVNNLAYGALVTDIGGSANAAAATLTIIPPVTSGAILGMGYFPPGIPDGGVSTLTLTLANPFDSEAVLSAPLIDSLPTRMVIAPTPNASTTCSGSGSVTATAGSSMLTLPTTRSIPAGTGSIPGTCTVTVDVTATLGGYYYNTTSIVSSNETSAGNSASATLSVVAPPTLDKAFSPISISAGGKSALTFTLRNPNPAPTALNGVSFFDVFPTGLQVAGTPNTSVVGCGSPVFAPHAAVTSITFSGGTIPAGGTCTVSVDVTARGGVYDNNTSVVSSTNGGDGNSASAELTVTGAGLALEKTTTNTGFQAAGTINYAYKLTNTGDTTLYAPFQVTDDHFGPAFDCGSATSLAPGDNLTCTASYSVLPSDVTAKHVTNIATASAMDSSTGGNQVTSNTSSVTVQLSELSLRKSTTTNGYRLAGDPIHYSYTLTNTGDVTLYPPFQVTDDHFGSAFTCGSPASLAPRANLTCTADYSVLAADVSSRSVTNIAFATAKDAPTAGNTVTSANSSVTVNLILPPVISKDFSATNPIAVGKTTTLTFTIVNPSSNIVPLTGVGFTDNFPAGLEVASDPDANQCGGSVTSTASSITLSGGTILAISSCTVTVDVNGTTSGIKNNLSNAVTSTNGGTGNTAADSLTVVVPPTISKAFNPTSISTNHTSTLTFIIANPNAGQPLTGISFSDSFPSGIRVAPTPNANVSGGCGSPAFTPLAAATSLTFNGGSLTAGGYCTVTVDVIGTTPGAKNNTSNPVNSTEGGTGATSNTATLNVDVASMSLTKSIVTGSPYKAVSDVISYSYVLTNTGTLTLIGNGAGGLFTITDDKIPATQGVVCPATPAGLAPGDNLTCTATYTIAQADLDVGQVVNQAVGHGKYGSMDVPTNTATQTALATQTPKLTLIKTITSGNPYKAVNGIIRYGYQLTNAGNVTLKGNGDGGLFTVSDDQIGMPKSSAFTCGLATSLAPGGVTSCTADFTVGQNDLDRGYVTNKATGSGVVTDDAVTSLNGQLVTSNEDTQTALVYDLMVVKTDDTVGKKAVLEKPFTWTVTASSVPSARSVFAQNDIIVSDPLPATAVYGTPNLVPGANITGTITCSIKPLSPDTLICTASGGPVTIGTDQTAGSFAVSFSATPTSMAQLSNVVTVNPNHLSDEIDSSNNVSTDTLAVTAPDLTVTKSDDQSGNVILASAGTSTFKWTIKVENKGDASASFTAGQTLLTDTLPALATYATPTLAQSAGVTGPIQCGILSRVLTCTANGGDVTIGTGTEYFSVSIDVSPTAAGILVNNTAHVDPDDRIAEKDETNNFGSDSVTVHAPDLTLAKTNDQGGSVLLNTPGTPTFNWILKAQNKGDSNANFASGDTLLSDTLPGAADYGTPLVAASAGVTGAGNIACQVVGNNLTCTAASGPVVIGPSSEFITVTISAAPTAVGSLVNNSAVVDPSNKVVESNEGNNTAANTVTVHAPDLKVTKTNDTGTNEVLLGKTFKWTLKVDNTGDAAAAFISGQTLLSDALPENATYNAPILDSSTGITGAGSITCAIASNTLTCAASTGDVSLAAATGSFTVSFVVTPTAIGDLINNPATVDPDNKIVESNELNNTAANTVKVTESDLVVSKDDHSATYVPGSPTIYTIVVQNTGDGNVIGAQVTDAIPAQVSTWTWTCGTATLGANGCDGITNSNTNFSDTINLPAGSSLTYTVTANTLSSAIVNLVNTVIAANPSGVTERTPADNTATDTDTPDPHATLSVSKTDGLTKYIPGSSILTYTITLHNAGPSDVTGAVLTDNLPTQIASWSWACTGTPPAAYDCNSGTANPFTDTVNLPASASLVYTVTTPKIASNQTGDLVNMATLTSAISPFASVTDTDNPDLRADLWVTKTDNQASYIPNQSAYSYIVTIGNDGPSDVIGAVLSDTRPAQLSSWSWACTTLNNGATGCAAGSASPFTNTVNLPSGSSIVYTVTVPTIAADQTANLVNTATITPPGGVTDTGPKPNTATDTDTADIETDLSITKSSIPSSFVPGDDSTPLVYTVKVSNAGPAKAVNAKVNDPFNAAAYKNWSWACTTVVLAANCSPVTNTTTNFADTVDIDPGGSITYTVTTLTKSSFRGNLTNTATTAVSGATGTHDPIPGNNTSSETDLATPVVALSIAKDDGQPNYVPGSSRTYTIVAANTGPSDSIGVVITDTKPLEVTNWTWTCGATTGGATGCDGTASNTANFSDTINLPSNSSQTYSVTVNTNSALTSTMVNTVTVTPGVGESEIDSTNNTSTDTDPAAPHAVLSVSKTDGQTQYIPGSSILNYTVMLSNAGPSDVTGAVLTDPIPAQVSAWTWVCTSGPANGCDGIANSPTDFSDTVNLPAGASITYTVTTAQIASSQTGNLVNTATLKSSISTDVSATDTDTPDLQADLQVTKSDGITSYTPGSTTVTYTVTLSNNGPSDVVAAVLSDTRPTQLASWSWSCTAVSTGASGCDTSSASPFTDTINLASGASITYTVTAPMVAADQTGSLVNTATITAPGGVIDTNPGNNTATDTDTPNIQADIQVTKTDGSPAYTPGVGVTYTIIVNNTGPSNATVVNFTDAMPTQFNNWTWTCGMAGSATGCTGGSGSSAINQTLNMPVDSSVTYTVTATPRSNAIGNLVNTASASPSGPAGITDPTPENNTSTDTDLFGPVVALSINKDDGTTSYIPGASQTYTIVVSNAGPSDSFGAVITDVKSAEITQWSWTCVQAGGASGCDNAGYINSSVDFTDSVNLPAKATITYTVTAVTDPARTSDLVNHASITHGPGEIEENLADNTASDNDTATPQADIVVTKTDHQMAYTPGVGLTYTIVVSNSGPSNATAVDFTDPMPNEFDSWSWTCAMAGSASGCLPGANSTGIIQTLNLPASGSATYTVSATPRSNATSTLDNNASAISTAPTGIIDPNPGNNSATDSDALGQVVALSITKTDVSATYIPGTDLTYTIIVSNAGPSDSFGAVIADTKPAEITSWSWTCIQASGANGCDGMANTTTDFSDSVNLPANSSITYTVNASTDSAATTSLVNTAAVTRGVIETETNLADNTAVDTDTPQPKAALTVTKSDHVSSYTPGQSSLTYTVTVQNSGPSDVTGAVLTDNRPAQITTWTWTCGLTTPPADACDGGPAAAFTDTVNIPAGGSITYTVTTGLIPSDKTGDLVNTVTVQSSISPDTTATDTDTPDLQADLWVTKTDGLESYIPGQTVLSYTVTIGNFGPSDALSAILSDTRPAQLASWSWACQSSTGGASGCTAGINSPFTDTVDLPAGSNLTYTVTAPMIAAGQTGDLVNSAIITPPAGVTETDSANNNATDTDSANLQADLWVTKADSTGLTSYVPGSPVTYTIIVGNAGPSNVIGATFSDLLPASGIIPSWTWTCAESATGACASSAGSLNTDFNDKVTIPASGSITYTVVAQTTSAATASLTNTAVIAPPSGVTEVGSLQNTATYTHTADLHADLSVTKDDGVSHYTAGDTLSYTIKVRNAGPSDVIGAMVSDIRPGSIDTWSWTCSAATFGAGQCGPAAAGSSDFTDTIDLPAGSSLTYTITAQVSKTAIVDPLINTVVVAAPAGVTEINPANNTATDSDALIPSADLSITKDDGVTRYTAGDTLTYAVTVHNTGPSAVTGAVITDTRPAQINTWRWDCARSDNGASGCNPAADGLADFTDSINLPAGSSITYTVTAVVSATSIADPLVNTANITAPNGVTEINLSNNTATDSDGLIPSADLIIVKTTESGNPVAGGSLTYTLQVSNAGPSEAANLVVTDTLPATETFVSASGAGWTCHFASGTLTCTLPKLAAGNVEVPLNAAPISLVVKIARTASEMVFNSASVTSDTKDQNPENNQDGISTNLLPAPDLVTQKTAKMVVDQNGDGKVNPGDTLEYTINIQNNGAAEALGVIFDDTPDPNTSIVANSVKASQGIATQGNAAGDTKVSINLGTIPPTGGSASITFRVILHNPLPAQVNQVSNQGLFTGDDFDPQVTDDPTTTPVNDPTLTPVIAAPVISVEKVVALAVDSDRSGGISPGDVLGYTITVTNSGNIGEAGVTLDDVPDTNSSLVVGSVSTTLGMVSHGNQAGDEAVGVAVDTLPGGKNAVITFQVTIHNPLPVGVSTVSNQALVQGSSITPTASDDPSTSPQGDPTVIHVVFPTGVTVMAFQAHPTVPNSLNVVISWSMAPTPDVSGFKVLRSSNGDISGAAVVSGETMIPIISGLATNDYTWSDQVPAKGQWNYWLVIIDRQGQETIYPVSAPIDLGNLFMNYLPGILK